MKIVNFDEDTLKFVLDNDAIKGRLRGGWRQLVSDYESPATSLVGFDGENFISIAYSYMQDKSTSLVITHIMVDNPIEVYTENCKYDPLMTEIKAQVNRILTQIME